MTNANNIASLYVVTDNGEMQVMGAGAPATIVRTARAFVEQHAGDDLARAAFGVPGITANGNRASSTVERFYASGLRNGQAFGARVPGILVIGALDDDAARAMASRMMPVQDDAGHDTSVDLASA